MPNEFINRKTRCYQSEKCARNKQVGSSETQEKMPWRETAAYSLYADSFRKEAFICPSIYLSVHPPTHTLSRPSSDEFFRANFLFISAWLCAQLNQLCVVSGLENKTITRTPLTASEAPPLFCVCEHTLCNLGLSSTFDERCINLQRCG